MTDPLAFARRLDALGLPLFTATAPGPRGAEFARPAGWQRSDPAQNLDRLAAFVQGAVCALLGDPLAVVDVDTKNGADPDAARAWLDALAVPVLADVATPSGGRHYWVPGHPDLPTVHADAERDGLDRLPGVELLSHGCNAFIPGTRRPKYSGRGYVVLSDRLDTFRPEMAEHGARLAVWVDAHRATRVTASSAEPPAAPWGGRDPDTRERAYLDAALTRTAARVTACQPGGRNRELYTAALKLGSLAAGAGLDEDTARRALADAADACGLTREDGPAAVRSTIRSGLNNGRRQPRAVPPPRDDPRTPAHPLAGLHPDAGREGRAAGGRDPGPDEWHEHEGPDDEGPDDEGPDHEGEGWADPVTGEVLDGPEGVELPTVEERLFGATPLLSTIRQAAHARLVTPWAVLGAVMARVVAELPPYVVLPPLVGGDASLNLAVAIVADSGGGKSGAVSCAADVVNIVPRRAQDIGPGSGEGIMMAFLERAERDPGAAPGAPRENVLKPHPLAVLTADEVAQIGAVQGRNSQSTFGPVVRTMLTGGPVGSSAVDAERRRTLPANSYRLTIVAGVQPKLSGVLLDDTDAGTPQRWLWLPADDPGWNVPPTEWPGSRRWSLPVPPRGDVDGRVRLPVPEDVVQAVRDARTRRMRREGDPLDGHRLLTREKVAAALALLHGEFGITPEWWALSGLVMVRSDATRAYCSAALSAKAEQESRARGHLDAARESGAREARSRAALGPAGRVWSYVAAAEGKHPNSKHAGRVGCTARCITHALQRTPTADRDAVLAVAEAWGWVERNEDDGRLYPGPSRPNKGGGTP